MARFSGASLSALHPRDNPPPKTRSDTHVLGLKPLWVVGDEVCGVSLSEVLCKHVLCVYNSSFNKGTWG